MMSIENVFSALWSSPESALWILCGARLLGLVLTVPFFSSRLIPFRFRVAFVVLLVLVLLGEASTSWRVEVASMIRQSTASLPVLVASEVFIGMAIGWAALLVVSAVRAAAILISEQVGFGFGGTVDPSVQQEEPVLRAFYGSLSVFVLLASDVHLRFLRAIGESFASLPPGSLTSEGALAGMKSVSLIVGSLLFEATLVLVFPVTAALFLASVAQGVLTRLFPELETVLFGFLLRSVVALGVVLLGVPFFVQLCARFFDESVTRGELMIGRLAG